MKSSSSPLQLIFHRFMSLRGSLRSGVRLDESFSCQLEFGYALDKVSFQIAYAINKA